MMGAKAMWGLSELPAQFFCELEIPLKIYLKGKKGK